MRLGEFLLGPNDTPENGIYTGDARILSEAIPDESVDLIFTDPVYQNIDDYRWLAETAARVLKMGSSLIVETCEAFRFKTESALRETSLVPRPLLAAIYNWGGAAFFKHKAQVHWRPYLWFTRGENRTGEWVMTSQYCRKEKKYHRWGDGFDFFVPYILRLAGNEGIVLDPFTGGGTVPAVCKMLGRRWLAFEIVPEVAETARQRVRQTQPPLFTLEMPQQLQMETLEVQCPKSD